MKLGGQACHLNTLYDSLYTDVVLLFFPKTSASEANARVRKPIFFFPHHYPIALVINKSPAVHILSPALHGLWRENRGSVTGQLYESSLIFYWSLKSAHLKSHQSGGELVPERSLYLCFFQLAIANCLITIINLTLLTDRMFHSVFKQQIYTCFETG